MSVEAHKTESPQNTLNEEAKWAKWTPKKTPWSPKPTPFEQLVLHNWKGSGTKDDPFLVEWLETDPENPQTWSDFRKWSLTVSVSIATLAVALSSSAYSGAIDSVREELGGSEEVLILGVSCFVLGFSSGPLIWAPFSELFGRRNLFLFTYAMMTLWQAVSPASPNIGALIAFRFLAGVFGSSALTNSGGTIADTFESNQRGLALAIFAAAPFMGPSLGPVTGGFLGQNAGWRWVEGFLAIFSGVIVILGFFILSETYAPVLLRWRAKRLSKATGNHYISALDEGKDTSLTLQFKVALSRPWQLLAREPIVVILSLYIAIIYATLYSFFAAFPLEFQQLRGWSPGVGGLAFMGILVGMILSLVYVIVYDNPRFVRKAKELGAIPPPEQRLPAAMVGGPLTVIGLAWFTASNSPDVFWLAPVMSGAPFGAGMVLIFLSLQNYLVDSYLIYAASVLAANSTIRSLLGAAFPLFTNYLYNPVNCPLATCGVKVGAGVSLALACLCLPAPFVLFKYGAHIRSRCKYAAEAQKIFAKINQQQINQQKRQHEKAEAIEASEEADNEPTHLEGGAKKQASSSSPSAAAAVDSERPDARDEEEAGADADADADIDGDTTAAPTPKAGPSRRGSEQMQSSGERASRGS